MPVRPEAEVHEIELAELADPELVRIRPFLAPHRVRGVRRADTVEQRLAGQPVVRALVVGRNAAFVAPVHVDLPPVDLRARIVCQPLVAPPRRVAPGKRHRVAVIRTRVKALDDTFRELRGDVVDDDELSEHWRENLLVLGAGAIRPADPPWFRGS